MGMFLIEWWQVKQKNIFTPVFLIKIWVPQQKNTTQICPVRPTVSELLLEYTESNMPSICSLPSRQLGQLLSMVDRFIPAKVLPPFTGIISSVQGPCNISGCPHQHFLPLIPPEFETRTDCKAGVMEDSAPERIKLQLFLTPYFRFPLQRLRLSAWIHRESASTVYQALRTNTRLQLTPTSFSQRPYKERELPIYNQYPSRLWTIWTK